MTPSRWHRSGGSPELKKAFGYLQGAVADAAYRLLAVPPDSLSLRSAEIEARFRDVLDQPVDSLTIDTAWELYGQVKAMLPLLASGDYWPPSSIMKRSGRRTGRVGTGGTSASEKMNSRKSGATTASASRTRRCTSRQPRSSRFCIRSGLRQDVIDGPRRGRNAVT